MGFWCRVSFEKEGGMRFTMNGNHDLYLVLITYVEVAAIRLKGSQTGWLDIDNTVDYAMFYYRLGMLATLKQDKKRYGIHVQALEIIIQKKIWNSCSGY